MQKICTLILALILMMGALYFGYNAGMRHIIEDAEIRVNDNIVTITIDGDAYEHVAE